MHIRKFLVHVSIFAIAVVLTDSAYSQSLPVPSSADASRLANPEKPLAFTLTNRGAAPSRPKFVETPKPENADQITLTLQSVTVKGAELYGADDLAHLWAEQLGQNIALSDVYAIADRVTKFYQDKGYILARAYIPAQEIDSGNVTIAVAEGKIGDVRFEGPFKLVGPLARAIEDMRTRSPLEIKRVERWTLHLNDFYGAQFRVLFKSAAEFNDPAIPEDSVVLVLIGERKNPVEAAVTFDNSGSRFLGSNTVTATAAINYGDPHFQRTQVTLTQSTQRDELKIAAIEHAIPLSANGFELKLDAQTIQGRPAYSLENLEIESKSKQVGVALEWTPIRQRDETLTLRGKFDAQNADTHILGDPFSEDNIRAVRLAARYETLTPGAITAAELRLDRGLENLLGASERGDLDLSRAEGRPDFTKFGASISRRQQILQDYEISGDMIAQYSGTPLLSSEEFGYGGAGFGRAYDPSEIVGDKGLAASVEFRHTPFDFGYADIQPFVFYDFGKVWNLDAGQPKTESGASAGFGARAAAGNNLNASVAFAKPLTRSISTPQGYSDKDGPRVQFNLTAKY